MRPVRHLTLVRLEVLDRPPDLPQTLSQELLNLETHRPQPLARNMFQDEHAKRTEAIAVHGGPIGVPILLELGTQRCQGVRRSAESLEHSKVAGSDGHVHDGAASVAKFGVDEATFPDSSTKNALETPQLPRSSRLLLFGAFAVLILLVGGKMYG